MGGVNHPGIDAVVISQRGLDVRLMQTGTAAGEPSTIGSNDPAPAIAVIDKSAIAAAWSDVAKFKLQTPTPDVQESDEVNQENLNKQRDALDDKVGRLYKSVNVIISELIK